MPALPEVQRLYDETLLNNLSAWILRACWDSVWPSSRFHLPR